MSAAGANDRQSLEALCALVGVQTEFTGNDGARRRARPLTLMAVLGALGLPVGGVADIPEALRAVRSSRAGRVMEPVLVQWLGERRSVHLVLPAGSALDQGWHELELEDGTVRRRPLSRTGWSPTARDEVDGRTLDSYELPLDGGGLALPPGYHRLTVHVPDPVATALVIVAPTCPLPTPAWGTFLPLHALRTEHDRGVGTYADLGRLAQWTGQVGGALVGTLPLYPVYLEEPVDPSPYRPVTKLGLSELYIDPTGLPELEIAPVARRLLASDALRQEVEASRASRFVDHGPVMATLRSVLAPMAEALFTTSSDRRSELEAFAAARPELAAYARFRSACDRLGSQWTGWSAAEVAMAGRGTDDDGEHFHLYVQWVAEQQLAAVGTRGGAGLYLDIPIGVHPSGFDPWWQRRAFATGVSGGAPPTPSSPVDRTGGFRRSIPRAFETRATAISSPRCARPSATPTLFGLTTSWGSTASTGCRTAPMTAMAPTCSTGTRRCAPSSRSRPAERGRRWSGRTSAPFPIRCGRPWPTTGCSDPGCSSSRRLQPILSRWPPSGPWPRGEPTTCLVSPPTGTARTSMIGNDRGRWTGQRPAGSGQRERRTSWHCRLH